MYRTFADARTVQGAGPRITPQQTGQERTGISCTSRYPPQWSSTLLDRDYGRSPHPPTCTCVACTERRNRRSGRRSVGDRLTGSGGNWGVMIGAAVVIVVIVAIILALG